MGLQRKQNQDMDLALSTDPKPRLRWTPALHQRFIEAVTQLGGEKRATPLCLMSVMRIPGLTLYHLKSHLQKYRLENKVHSGSCNYNEQDGGIPLNYMEGEIRGGHVTGKIMEETHTLQINKGLHIAQAQQMQKEVRNKIHQQIERHLQLRIEAQGMYLQSILQKAQETLGGCHYSPAGLENSKTDVSEMVETGWPSSKLTNIYTDCSVDSSLTSSESSERKDGKLPFVESGHRNRHKDFGPSYKLGGRKRSGSSISDESCVEQSITTIPPPEHHQLSKLKKLGHSEEVDLNFNCRNESTTALVELDLNCAPPELFDES